MPKYRGNDIELIDDEWLYSDTRSPVKDFHLMRVCGNCNKPYTKEGHDACLGTLRGVMNACCGHGDAQTAYVQFLDGSCISGKAAKIILNILKWYRRPKVILENDRYTYRVTWSEEDKEYVGLCVEFSGLSWLASTQEEALQGIRQAVADVVADMKVSGELAPEPISIRQYNRVRLGGSDKRHLYLFTQEEGNSMSVQKVIDDREKALAILEVWYESIKDHNKALRLISIWYDNAVAPKHESIRTPEDRGYFVCPVCHNTWDPGDKPRHYAICWIPKVYEGDY